MQIWKSVVCETSNSKEDFFFSVLFTDWQLILSYQLLPYCHCCETNESSFLFVRQFLVTRQVRQSRNGSHVLSACLGQFWPFRTNWSLTQIWIFCTRGLTIVILDICSFQYMFIRFVSFRFPKYSEQNTVSRSKRLGKKKLRFVKTVVSLGNEHIYGQNSCQVTRSGTG